MRKLLAAALCALSLAACSKPPQGGPIVLTYSTSYGPSHPFSRADIAWIKHVEAKSGGRLKIKPYWSGSLLSAEQSMLEIRHGVADIGLVTPIYVRGGAHLTAGQSAFYAGADGIDEQVAVYKCLAAEFPGLKREMDGLHVLAVQGGNLPGVVTRERPVRSAADFKGLRLRVPEEYVPVLKALGGDPVSMPMSEVYSALAKGVIDGVVVAPDALRALHFTEVAKYYSPLHAPRGAYPARAISAEKLRSLPPDLQQVLIEGQPVWEAALKDSITKAAKVGLDFGREKGMTFTTVAAADQAAFDASYIGVAKREAHRLDPYGADGDAMLARAQAIIAAQRAGASPACGAAS